MSQRDIRTALGAGFAGLLVLAVPWMGWAQETTRVEFRFIDSAAHAFAVEERGLIRDIGEATVAELSGILEGLPTLITVTVEAGPGVIPETGDGGLAAAPGRIAWTVDPARPGGVAAIARTHLRATLAHEIHHLARGWTVEGGTAGSRMIDAAVSEGLATVFARDVTGSDPPWGHYDSTEADGWVDELLEVPNLATYQTWMFQHPDGRRWIGYRAGAYIADRAKEACRCSAADLVRTATDEIIEMLRRAR